MTNNKNLFQLSWPIFIEILLFMLMGVADTLMLSKYSDTAVAAVGTSNQLLSMFGILLNIVSAGVVVMITQSLGALKNKEANEYAIGGLIANGAIGLVLSLLIVLLRVSILQLMNTPVSIIDIASQYTFVVGASIFFMALASTNGAILRSNGYTKVTMVITLIANVFNVIGNYILIFGKFGAPELGPLGTAITTTTSRIGIVVVGFIILSKKVNIKYDKSILSNVIVRVREILKIGLPRALEQFSWNVSQTVIFSYVALLGEYAITTRVYITNITWFVFLIALAVAQGNQILVGYFIGAKDYDGAYKRAVRSNLIAMGCSFTLALIAALNAEALLGLLTDDPEIIKIGTKILWVGLFIEPSRAINLVIIHALGSASDVYFPMFAALISMWGIGVFGTHLSYTFGFGLVGIYFATGMDEFLRGIAVLIRWKSKVWINKTQVE